MADKFNDTKELEKERELDSDTGKLGGSVGRSVGLSVRRKELLTLCLFVRSFN